MISEGVCPAGNIPEMAQIGFFGGTNLHICQVLQDLRNFFQKSQFFGGRGGATYNMSNLPKLQWQKVAQIAPEYV